MKKKIFYLFILITLCLNNILLTHASLTRKMNENWYVQNIQKEVEKDETNFFVNIWEKLFLFLLLLICLYLLVKIVRTIYEIKISKKLVYMQVSLPKADSKLDKEKETKKDFKEKVATMWMLYKSLYKINDISLKDTLINFIYNTAKIAFELVYDNWELRFFVITYPNCVNLVAQHITSIYNDAEVKIIDKKKEYIKLKPYWYTIRTASLAKKNQDVFPIRTFKYLEDDPLNNFTNVFSSLNKDDKAIYQIVIKPVWARWAKKAKKAASLVAKWQFNKKKIKLPFADILWNPIVTMVSWYDNAVKSNSNAPWASSWDSYKIFNQAETEAQKIMWESAW